MKGVQNNVQNKPPRGTKTTFLTGPQHSRMLGLPRFVEVHFYSNHLCPRKILFRYVEKLDMHSGSKLVRCTDLSSSYSCCMNYKLLNVSSLSTNVVKSAFHILKISNMHSLHGFQPHKRPPNNSLSSRQLGLD